MLSIGKLSAASVDYYTEQLAHSVGEDLPVLRGGGVERRADYYAGHESPARWMGTGLPSAGVDPASAVTKEAFARLMGHETPGGVSMTRARAAHGSVAAFDHTFSAPKSVSLLYAYGDDRIRETVREAHLNAVSEAVGFMEARCAQARIGSRWRDEAGRWHVATRVVDSRGWVTAAFDHYTSRANDPQLHTHVVVINRVHTDDGWRALDARYNYSFAKAGGCVYEAKLRDELTHRLGVRWGPVVNGIADIEGFTPELLWHFSTRRAEILEAVDRYVAQHGGQPHRRMLQAFTLETRQPKHHPRGDPEMTAEMRDYGVGSEVTAHWQQKALDAPQDPVEVVRQVIAAGRRGFRPDPSTLIKAAAGIVEQVTDRQAVFTKRDLLAHVAALYPDGASSAELDRATGQILAAAVQSGEALVVLPAATRDAVALPDGVTLTTDELTQVLSERTDGINGKGQLPSRALPGEARYTTRLQLEREQRVLAGVHSTSPVTVNLDALEAAISTKGQVSDQATAMRHLASLEGRVVALVGPGGSGKTYAVGAYAGALEAAGHRVIGVAPTATAARKLADHMSERWTGTVAMLGHHLDTRGEQLPRGTVVVCDEASMVSTRDLVRLVDYVEGCDGKLVLFGDPRQLPSIDSGGLFHRLVADGHGVVTDLAEVNQRQQIDVDRQALHRLRAGETRRAVLDYTEAGRLHLGYQRDDTRAAMVDAWWADTRINGVDQVRMLAAHRHDVDLLNQFARARMQASGLLTGAEVKTRWGTIFQAGDRIVVRENWYAHADLRNGQTGTITSVNPVAGSVTFRRDHDQVEIIIPKRYVDSSVDYGYAQTIHTAQGHTYQQTHLYLDTAITAEHGYTALSRAREETHLWVADASGPVGDCLHHRSGPLTEDRIDTLVRQLSRSSLQPPATNHDMIVASATDDQLITRRDHLARILQASSLTEDPSLELAALDAAITDARAMATQAGTGNHQITYLENRRQDLVDQITGRLTWIEDNTDLIHQYTTVVEEVDRRIHARTFLYQIDPPEDVLTVLGPRATAAYARQWDAAVEVYARVRLHAGPDADLMDPANHYAGPWRDIVQANSPIEQSAPVLRRTG